MKNIEIGIVCFDEAGQNVVREAFEDILLDEICTKTLYDKTGEEGVELSLTDWEEGKTDAIVIVPEEDKPHLNPASIKGLDMLVWQDLRMAFADPDTDHNEQLQLLHLALRRDFDIDCPRIVPHLDPQNYRTYDAVLVNDREQGTREFLELSGGNAVAFTTGRELICTSPYSAESFRESIYLAKDIQHNRYRYDSARRNPLPKLFVEKKEDNNNRKRNELDR